MNTCCDKGDTMKKRNFLYALSSAVLVAVFLSSASFASVPVKVAVGKGTVISLSSPSKRVAVSDPKIADVNLISPSEMLVNGRQEGSTSLIVWDAAGKKEFFDVTVYAEPSAKCGNLAVLNGYFNDVAPGSDIKAECRGNTLVLSGTIKNRYTCKRDNVPVVTRKSENGQEDIETQDKDICTETYTRLEQVAAAFAPGIKVLNLVTIPEEDQVMLEVKVAQVDKTALKNLGISWLAKGPSAEGFINLIGAPSGSSSTQNFIGPGVSTTGTGIEGNIPGLGGFNPLDPFQAGISDFGAGIGSVLKLLAQHDLAKILASPNLVVRSGEEGKFLVGTKVPVQVVTGTAGAQTAGITFEDVGIKLNFKPQVLETGQIRLKIDPAEVSTITQFITFSSGIVAPEIDTRQVSTSVDLKEGESLVMAGLLDDEMKKTISKIPLLGDIPILGALFRSTTDELTKRELVFFITPKIVKAIPAGQKTELPGEKPLTPQEKREYQWIPVVPGSGGSK